MTVHINRDDWLKALHDAGVHDDVDDQDAVTAIELSAMFGLSRIAAERRLKKLAATGKAMRSRKRVLTSDGRTVSCVAYRLR